MPRGGGATYNYANVKEAVYEFLCSLEMGDRYTGADISIWLRDFKGLSKNDKKEQYCLNRYTLERSENFWIVVANLLIKEYDLPIIKRKMYLREFESGDNLSLYEHEISYNKTYYTHTGF